MKEFRYETPASLDDRNALCRTESGWSLVECAELDGKDLVGLRPKSFCAASGVEDDFRKVFALNLESSRKTRAEDGTPEEKCEQTQPEEAANSPQEPCVQLVQPKRAVRIAESQLKVLEFSSAGKSAVCRAGRKIFQVKGCSSAPGESALKVSTALPGEEEETLLIYEKLWESSPSSDDVSPLPEIRAFLPLTLKGEKESELDEEGGMTTHSFMLMESVRFVFPGCRALPQEAFDGIPVVFGTWMEPRRVFRVRMLLKLLFPEDVSKDFPERGHVPLVRELWTTLDIGRRLFPLSRWHVREMMSGEEFSWKPESVEGFVKLREMFDQSVEKAADALAENGEIRRGFEDAGQGTPVRLDLGDLAETGIMLSERLSAVYCDMPSPDYREILEILGLGEHYRRAFDTAFVVSALNLGIDKSDVDDDIPF